MIRRRYILYEGFCMQINIHLHAYLLKETIYNQEILALFGDLNQADYQLE